MGGEKLKKKLPDLKYFKQNSERKYLFNCSIYVFYKPMAA